MPLYEYSCEKCHTVVEKIQKFSDPPLLVCEKCGGPLIKLMGKPALQFKGSGFYITDYVKKSGEEKSSDKETKSETAAVAASAPSSSPPPAASSPVSTTPAASE
jgi:putative FmdB family regulatory protein